MAKVPEVGCRAARLDFCFEQGAAFDITLTWREKAAPQTPIDLTGFTARMKVVKDADTTPVTVLELTTGNSRITLGGTAGTIRLLVTATDTAALLETDFENTCYDLELVPGAPNAEEVTRLIEGNARLKTEKTT